MSVYFIQAASGPVKIGHSRNPEGRLLTYRGCHYEKLRLIRLINGSKPTEAWFHEKFCHLKIRGEWFHFDNLMMTIAPPADLLTTASAIVNFVHKLRESGSTFTQIGKALGVTKQRAHQIYNYSPRAQEAEE